MQQEIKTGVADVAVPIGWGAWVASHLAQVNEVLQFVLLITSIAATILAMRYHWRNTPK